MRFSRPLDDALRSRSHIRVLRALYALPTGFPVSAREIARRAGVSHPTASSALFLLADQGLVILKRVPRADLFQLNSAHVLVEQLSPLLAWEQDALGDLLSFLRKWIDREAGYIQTAIMFGSVARGTMTATSDIDVAIVCPAGRVGDLDAAMDRLGEAVRARFGNRLNVMVRTSPLSPAREQAQGEDRLWSRIAEEGIAIVGALRVESDDA